MADIARNREVPAYRRDEFAEKAHEYCVCVFVINENGRLHSQLERMRSLADIIDIVIADGGSTDGSTKIDKLSSYGVNTLLTKEGEGKLGAQMRMAFDWALKRGYKGVVVVDGNNKDGVEDIPCFIEKLVDGYDHVQGSRFIEGGRHENTPLSRLFAVKLIHAPVLSLAAGVRCTDTTNGFRAYSRRLLLDPEIGIFRDVFAHYELHYYLTVKSARHGYRCAEIPVTRRYPPSGKTPTKISAIKGNLRILAKLFGVACGRYDG